MKMTGQYRPFLGGQLHRFFHDDWYLPSINELNLLNQSKDKIGGFSWRYYLSSTKGAYSDALRTDFSNGNTYDGPSEGYFKGLNVRAVRAF
jgi:hypothetical protein